MMSSASLTANRWIVLVAVMLAFLPVVLDMTILHVAVPTLTQSLNASGTEVLWIIDIYPLLMAGLLVPMGTLADRVGNRRMLLIGLVIFGVASAWAAFAQSAAILIAARILLALGGSMIMPCVLGLIRKTFEDEGERAMALGLWGMVGAAGAAVGPLVGGALLEHLWWGSVFLINVPVMLVVAPACYFLLPRSEPTTPGKWAIGQALLLIAGMISLVYGIKAGFGGKQPLTIVILIVVFGIAALTLFARKQLHSSEPMLDLSLLSHPAIVAGLIMAIVASGALAGVELTLAQELQYVLDKTPLQAGIFMIPIMAAGRRRTCRGLSLQSVRLAACRHAFACDLGGCSGVSRAKRLPRAGLPRAFHACHSRAHAERRADSLVDRHYGLCRCEQGRRGRLTGGDRLRAWHRSRHHPVRRLRVGRV